MGVDFSDFTLVCPIRAFHSPSKKWPSRKEEGHNLWCHKVFFLREYLIKTFHRKGITSECGRSTTKKNIPRRIMKLLSSYLNYEFARFCFHRVRLRGSPFCGGGCGCFYFRSICFVWLDNSPMNNVRCAIIFFSGLQKQKSLEITFVASHHRGVKDAIFVLFVLKN